LHKFDIERFERNEYCIPETTDTSILNRLCWSIVDLQLAGLSVLCSSAAQLSDAVALNVVRSVAALNVFWFMHTVTMEDSRIVHVLHAILAGLGIARGGFANDVRYAGAWNCMLGLDAVRYSWGGVDAHDHYTVFALGYLNCKVSALLFPVQARRTGGSTHTHSMMALFNFFDVIIAHWYSAGDACPLRVEAAHEHLTINTVLGAMASVTAVRRMRCTTADTYQPSLLERALAALAVFHLVRGRLPPPDDGSVKAAKAAKCGEGVLLSDVKKGVRVMLRRTAHAKGSVKPGDVGTIDEDNSDLPWVRWDGRKGREYFHINYLALL
jgi:hypothetical protein